MTVQVIIEMQLNGVTMINRFNYIDDGVLPMMAPEDIVEGVLTDYATLWAPSAVDRWSIVAASYVDPDAGGGQPATPVASPQLPIVGQVDQPSMANQVALLINWKTANQAPWRGRTYLCGMGEASMEDGSVFGSGVMTAAQNLADALLTQVNGMTEAAALAIRSEGTSTIPAGQTSGVVVATASNNPATLRSRRVGNGS